MTLSVRLFGAKARLSELVAHVSEGGEPVVITKQGKAVAQLGPVVEESSVDAALTRLLAARQGSTPGEGTLRELIEDDRRW